MSAGGLRFDLLDEHVGEETPNISTLESPVPGRVGGMSVGPGGGSAAMMGYGHHHHGGLGGANGGGSRELLMPGGNLVHKGMTLKEQEKIIDELRKENYALKMRIYFLEDRVNKMTPVHMNEALRENVELKVQLHKAKDEEAILRDQLQSMQDTLETMQGPRLDQVTKAARERAEADGQMIERLEIQLEEMRNAKLELEDKVLQFQDHDTQMRGALDSARSEVQTLCTELGMARTQADGLKAELLDTQVQAQAAQSKGSPKKQKSSRRSSTLSDRKYQESLSHLNAQITAQNMIMSTREAEIERLQNDVTTLTHELHDTMRELEAYKSGSTDPALLAYAMDRTGSADQNRHMSALKVQLSEISRQLSERTTEAATLRRELDVKAESHESTVAGLMEAWTRDQADLKRSVTEAKRKLQQATLFNEELQAKLQQTEEQLARSHADRDASEQNLMHRAEIQEENQITLVQELESAKSKVTALSSEVRALQGELTDRVHGESDTRHELYELRRRFASASESASDTLNQVAVLEAQLAQHAQKVADVEGRWRDEVAARSESEAKHVERISVLDSSLRKEMAQVRGLQRKLEEREAEIDELRKAREIDSKAADDAADRKWEAERTKAFEEYKRQMATLERAHSDARTALVECKHSLRQRDAELADIRQKYERATQERDEHHKKLTQIIADSSNAKASRESDLAKIHDLESQLARLRKQHADALGMLRRTASAEKLSTADSSKQTIYKLFTQVSSLLGKPADAVRTSSLFPLIDLQLTKASQVTSESPSAVILDLFEARIYDLAQLNARFEKGVRAIEDHWASEFRLFLGKFDRKTAQIEKSEAAIRAATAHVRQWKSLVSQLQARVRQEESRAQTAEAREQDAVQASLKASTRSGSKADSHNEEDSAAWANRAKMLERQLREAEDRARRERHGAREKVQGLIHAVRELERQLEAARKMNEQYQDIVQHQREKLEDAMQSTGDRKYERLKEEYVKLEHALDQKDKAIQRVLAHTGGDDLSRAIGALRLEGERGSPLLGRSQGPSGVSSAMSLSRSSTPGDSRGQRPLDFGAAHAGSSTLAEERMAATREAWQEQLRREARSREGFRADIRRPSSGLATAAAGPGRRPSTANP